MLAILTESEQIVKTISNSDMPRTLVLTERGEEEDEEKTGKDDEDTFFKTEDPLRQGEWALGEDAVDQVANADHEQALQKVNNGEDLFPVIEWEDEACEREKEDDRNAEGCVGKFFGPWGGWATLKAEERDQLREGDHCSNG